MEIIKENRNKIAWQILIIALEKSDMQSPDTSALDKLTYLTDISFLTADKIIEKAKNYG